MKNLRMLACIATLSIYGFTANAQKADIPLNEPVNKPEIFKQKPDKVAIEPFQVASLLTSQVGEPVVLNLPSFRFEGTVISTVSKYENSMQSVVIRSTNYFGAVLTISRTTDSDGNALYAGRIISMLHGDLYELKKVDNGFALIKNKFNTVVAE